MTEVRGCDLWRDRRQTGATACERRLRRPLAAISLSPNPDQPAPAAPDKLRPSKLKCYSPSPAGHDAGTNLVCRGGVAYIE